MHLQQSSQTLAFSSCGVINDVARVDRTRINAEVAKLSDKRVGHDLECQRRERLCIRSISCDLLIGMRINSLHRRNVHRRRHIINDCVQKFLNALITVRRTAHHRNQLVGNGCIPERCFDFFLRDFFLVDEFLHQRVIDLGSSLNHSGTVFLRLLQHIFRNRFNSHVFAKVIIINIGFHGNQIDNAPECHFLSDRQLNRYRICVESFLHHVNNTIEVCAGNVHFIDICHSRHMITVSLSPHGFRLRLNASLCTENSDRAIQHTQRSFNLNGKVNVSGSINDIDTVVLPETCGGSRSNGDTSLLLFRHPVHGCRPFVRFPYFVHLSGIKQNSFGGSGFSGIDVCHDADIARTLK